MKLYTVVVNELGLCKKGDNHGMKGQTNKDGIYTVVVNELRMCKKGDNHGIKGHTNTDDTLHSCSKRPETVQEGR